jgi:hypothetical protein
VRASTGLAAPAMCSALRTQLEATVMRRAKLRKALALLERRRFLAMLAARLLPGVPATGLHDVAGGAPVGVRRGDGARRLMRTAPYAVLGPRIGWGRSPRF